jgi:hypothetical protein
LTGCGNRQPPQNIAGNFPASTIITVHSLPAVGMMLEISAIALIGDK